MAQPSRIFPEILAEREEFCQGYRSQRIDITEKENTQKQKLANEKYKQRNEEKTKVAEKVNAIDRSIAEENVLNVAENLLKESNQALMDLIKSSKAVKKATLVHTQMVLDTAITKLDEIKLNLNKLSQQKNELLEKKK